MNLIKLFLALYFIVSVPLEAEDMVLAFSGSTREDSMNKKLLAQAVSIAKEKGAKVTVIDLRNFPMPFYDGDLEVKEGMPLTAKELRRLMIDSKVILISSPEYNGSVPGVLKNAIDWASRSESGKPSREAFAGKTFVIMSASPGSGGGVRGLRHLREILENIGGKVVPQQVVVPDSYNAFDQAGKLKDPKTKKELQQLVESALNSKVTP